MAQESSAGQPKAFHCELVDRLWNYSLVNYTYQKASNVYTAVKQSNSLIKYALETAENNVSKIATPLAYKILDKSKPLLVEIDEFGCKQLDKLEDKFFKPYETLTYVPYVVFEKVLDIMEGTVDYFLPPSKETLEKERLLEDEAKEESKKAGPKGEQERDYELTKSKFRYLQRRAVALSRISYQRLRERSKNIPFVVRIMDYTALQLEQLKGTVAAALDFAAKTRTNAYLYVKNVLGQFKNLAYAIVEPFWRLALISVRNFRNGIESSRNRLTQALNNLISFLHLDAFFNKISQVKSEQKRKVSKALSKKQPRKEQREVVQSPKTETYH